MRRGAGRSAANDGGPSTALGRSSSTRGSTCTGRRRVWCPCRRPGRRRSRAARPPGYPSRSIGAKAGTPCGRGFPPAPSRAKIPTLFGNETHDVARVATVADLDQPVFFPFLERKAPRQAEQARSYVCRGPEHVAHVASVPHQHTLPHANHRTAGGGKIASWVPFQRESTRPVATRAGLAQPLGLRKSYGTVLYPLRWKKSLRNRLRAKGCAATIPKVARWSIRRALSRVGNPR